MNIFKSIGVWLIAALGIFAALFNRERNKNKKLEQDIADHRERMRNINKSKEVSEEIDNIIRERKKMATKALEENEQVLEKLKNETDNPIIVDNIRKLLNDPKNKD